MDGFTQKRAESLKAVAASFGFSYCFAFKASKAAGNERRLNRASFAEFLERARKGRPASDASPFENFAIGALNAPPLASSRRGSGKNGSQHKLPGLAECAPARRANQFLQREAFHVGSHTLQATAFRLDSHARRARKPLVKPSDCTSHITPPNCHNEVNDRQCPLMTRKTAERIAFRVVTQAPPSLARRMIPRTVKNPPIASDAKRRRNLQA